MLFPVRNLVLSIHKIISVIFVIFCVLSTTLTVAMQIDDLAEVDYSLSSLPAVFQPFIDLDLKVAACSAVCQDCCGFHHSMRHFLR